MLNITGGIQCEDIKGSNSKYKGSKLHSQYEEEVHFLRLSVDGGDDAVDTNPCHMLPRRHEHVLTDPLHV